MHAPAFLMLLPAWVAAAQAPCPDLVTDRALERTGFQEASPYDPRYDLRTDFVMAYGVDAGAPARLQRWAEAGYVLQVMTGVAWGNYQDFLDGAFDGRKHWDEGQVDGRGASIDHGPTVPYMVPSVAFSAYLEKGIRRVIDAGAAAVHLEEPEFWARAGFSEAFKREWRIFYREPWRRPDADCDAQYRASKLKHYLYRRTLDRLCASMKEYALAVHGREARFYVPTHSLLNYTQWSIVSPESALIDLPGVDGYIAQVWTGTARTANVYAGRAAERTFETAFLEYGVMRELVRGTGKRMWFLHDPIEDNPAHDWNDYRANYFATLVASLLQPDVWHYEVAPWPRRVFLGRYPAGKPDATPIPARYATTLAVVINQLRDMAQTDIEWPETTGGVGVFLADSAMFQRAEPAFSQGTAPGGDDPTRATSAEVRMLSGFYGLALPPLLRGIPMRPVQLDNVARFPGYLDGLKVLLLSYEILKPREPGLHLALAQWVQAGGALLYVGADTDPFNSVREWWNAPPAAYAAPSAHLFEALGLGRAPAEGRHACGKGAVFIERVHPAYYSRSPEAAARLCARVREAVGAAGGAYAERTSLLLRRGPYVLAAALREAPGAAPLRLEGQLVDLLDADLPVLTSATVAPGACAWLLDLDRVRGGAPRALAAAGRIEKWAVDGRTVRYTIATPEGVAVAARLLLPAAPVQVTAGGAPCGDAHWDEASRTLLLRHAGHAAPVAVTIEW